MFSKTTRSEGDVVADLLALTGSPGYVHAIAAICVRDNLVVYREELTVSDMEKVHQPSRLLRTELMVLLGFMCRSERDLAEPTAQDLARYVARSDELLSELHEAMWLPMRESMLELLNSVPSAGGEEGCAEAVEVPPASGESMREAIFYGTESAHHFQYRDMAPEKYGRDDAWLLANKGFTSGQASVVARTMCDEMSARGAEIYGAAKQMGVEPSSWLAMFEFRADDVAHRSGVALDAVQAFMRAFTLPGNNEGFRSVGDFNEVVAMPLIPTGAGGVLLFDHGAMYESLYESPFYWMFADKTYRPTANEHRGAFTETFSARRLATVFGRKNVHANVNLYRGKNRLGEADVLVTFGDRIIVVQAKAKKLTLAARKGNDGLLRTDFAAAIQDACDQGWECANAILAKDCRLEDDQGNEVQLPAFIKQVFTLCVVAEHYPALAHQAREYLKAQRTDVILPPLVMDVFLLDTMTEFLSSPVRLLHYLRMRLSVGDEILVNHEFTALAYHLQTNLWPQDEFSMAYLDDSFTVAMDTAMSVRRDGHAGERTPPGILTKFIGTPFGRVVSQFEEQSDAGLMEFCFLLLSFGEDAVRGFNRTFDALVRQGRADRRLHDASFHFGGGEAGVTMHFNPVQSQEAVERLRAHCEMRKYAVRAPQWFGISIGSQGQVQFAVGAMSRWEQSAEMDELTAGLPDASGGHEALRAFARQARAAKVGRNSPCPCASGKKFKKCCLV
ncbi:YecA family protein [Rhizobacter sp. P5_C2]